MGPRSSLLRSPTATLLLPALLPRKANEIDTTTLIAIYAAIVSTIVLLIQFAEFARGADDLKLSISTGIGLGDLEMLTGTSHIIQVTVASRGNRPVGVSSLNLELNDGRALALIYHLPVTGSRQLPAVLERGQFSTYWLRHDTTRQELMAQGVRIKSVVAHLTDGTSVKQRAPADWRALGS